MSEEWKKRAACRGTDTSIFFPDPITKNVNARMVWVQARQICDKCPVKQECLDYQIPFEMVSYRYDGMWGGLTPTERRAYIYNNKKKPRLN